MNDETNNYSAPPGFILTLQSENIIQKKNNCPNSYPVFRQNEHCKILCLGFPADFKEKSLFLSYFSNIFLTVNANKRLFIVSPFCSTLNDIFRWTGCLQTFSFPLYFFLFFLLFFSSIYFFYFSYLNNV